MAYEFQIDATADQIPYLTQWFGPWACHAHYMDRLQSLVGAIDIAKHMASGAPMQALAAAEGLDYSVTDGVAVIPVNGIMLKHMASYGDCTSTVKLRRLVGKAVADPAVKGIALKLDSPGGTVSGTMELASDIRAAGEVKPTMAFCSDLAASAAYWVAAQCGKIYANEMASVGSIGTYCVVRDSSKAAEAIGVTVHVVRAGAFKGAMTDGTQVTEEHLAEAQRLIDGINAKFVGMVADGRGMSTEAVKAIADGRVHLAGDALSLGLIDQVASWEEAFSDFASGIGGTRASIPASPPATSTSAQEPLMSDPQPATALQLKTALPRAGAAFVLSCLEASMTLAESQAAYMSHLVGLAEAAAAKKPGVVASRNGRRIKAEDAPLDEEEKKKEDEEEDDVAMEDEDEDESEMAWRKAVNREMATCGGDRRKAVSKANRKNPGLRAAMVRSVNARSGRRAVVR